MTIRNLREHDLEYAASLTVIEGWHYTVKELGFLLRMDPDGSFIYEQGGEPVGFATTITYGRTGVLGHLVVGAQGQGEGHREGPAEGGHRLHGRPGDRLRSDILHP